MNPEDQLPWPKAKAAGREQGADDKPFARREPIRYRAGGSARELDLVYEARRAHDNVRLQLYRVLEDWARDQVDRKELHALFEQYERSVSTLRDRVSRLSRPEG